MREVIISIDPGLKGAIVVYDTGVSTNSSASFVCYKMPVIGDKKPQLLKAELNNILKPFRGRGAEVLVVYEKLGQIFESSKATAFSMGVQVSAIEMGCIAHELPYLEIPPKEWQAEMFTGVAEIRKTTRRKDKKTGVEKVSESRDTKAMAEVAIRRLRPDLKLTFAGMTKSAHDGLVDAYLLYLYALRKNL